jgi:hypothetical protein
LRKKKGLLETFLYADYIMKAEQNTVDSTTVCSLIPTVKLALKRHNLSAINEAQGY